MAQKPEGLVLWDGKKRVSGRGANELRPISMQVGVIPQVSGSAMVSFGKTQAIASVYGPKPTVPSHLSKPNKAIVRVEYTMAPFSTKDRISPKFSRRSQEISEILTRAFEAAIFTDLYPETEIDIFVQVINADAGTRIACLNAASLALCQAGIEMRDLVVGLTAGKVDGKVVLDLDNSEDNYGDADFAFAVMPTKNEIVALQMDGDLSKEEFDEALKLMKNGIQKIYQMQRDALLLGYKEESDGKN